MRPLGGSRTDEPKQGTFGYLLKGQQNTLGTVVSRHTEPGFVHS